MAADTGNQAKQPQNQNQQQSQANQPAQQGNKNNQQRPRRLSALSVNPAYSRFASAPSTEPAPGPITVNAMQAASKVSGYSKPMGLKNPFLR